MQEIGQYHLSERWTRSQNSRPQKCVSVHLSLPYPPCKLYEPDAVIRNEWRFFIQKLNQVFVPYKWGLGGGQGKEEKFLNASDTSLNTLTRICCVWPALSIT